jgi:hypothetical protein
MTKNGEPVTYPVPPELLNVAIVASVLESLDLAPDTAQRRAHTLYDWLVQL